MRLAGLMIVTVALAHGVARAQGIVTLTSCLTGTPRNNSGQRTFAWSPRSTVQVDIALAISLPSGSLMSHST